MQCSAPGTAPPSRKRCRSPPFPVVVKDYRPYGGGQLLLHVDRGRSAHKDHWDLYYRNNTINGYKDRHYILREFVELQAAIAEAQRVASPSSEQDGEDKGQKTTSVSSFSWMEAGCGVGNAMLPIFEEFGHLRQWHQLLGFDISSVAIKLLEEKKASLPPALGAKLEVATLDPCQRDVLDCPFFVKDANGAIQNPVQFVSMIFVLCSIPAGMHKVVLQRIASCMVQPGGVFFFRDYAVADHAETRFRKNEDRICDGDANTYARSNGTLSHFFAVEEVRALFESVGFRVFDLSVVTREVNNRKVELTFTRKFVQGRFILE